MEYKADERPSLNGHGAREPQGLQHTAVPASLLPAVLSRLGLGDRPMGGGDDALTALRDEKSNVRVAAVRSLGEGRETSSLRLLVTALDDPAWEVRAAAVWALSVFGEQAPVEALIKALADKDGSVRASALRVLYRVRGYVPPEPLSNMLHDADWQVHEAAAVTVEELEEQAIEVMGDRYQLQNPIGKGGMAIIYRGRDLHMDRVVAIKVLREVYSTDPKFVQRFQLEAKAASTLQHPNIVQVFDYGQTDGNYYIVMELVEGTDLRRYLRSRGVLDIDRAIIIAHDVALGLGAAHRRGIVHRDVKPQNVLVGRDGSIKLTDFGIASVYKDINDERLTTTGMTLGTVQYYPPEQAQGDIVSPAADVYSLGIVMYEMLTGRPPFDGDTPVAVAMQHIQETPTPPSQLNPNIPVALEEIILRCLEKVPEMRFRDGSQLARALEMLGDHQMGETLAAPFTPGHTPVPSASHPIPSRPKDSGRIASSNNQQRTSTSSSENILNGGFSDSRSGVDGTPSPADEWPWQVDPQGYDPSGFPPESSAAYPFQRGSISHSGVVSPGQRESRLVTLITVFILLATLVLLGFGILLTAQLGFLPFSNGGTQTSVVTQRDVPDLRGMTYQEAQQTTTSQEFQLTSQNGTVGLVSDQSPRPPAKGNTGDTIVVRMDPNETKVPSANVLVGNTLDNAEHSITSARLKFTVISDGPHSGAPNIVSRVAPAPGSFVVVGSTVTIYVWNLTP